MRFAHAHISGARAAGDVHVTHAHERRTLASATPPPDHSSNTAMSSRKLGQFAGASDSGIFRWWIEVCKKLGREEFQLLKSLYLVTLPLRVLQDNVKEPQDHAHLLYDLPLERDVATRSAIGDGYVREPLTPQQSLALFVHRLQLLVPVKGRLSKEDERHLGGKVCISSLESLLGVLPSVEGVHFPTESRLMECLVKCYVNLSSAQRCKIKEKLAECLGLNVEVATIFDVFAELFIKQRSNYDPQGIVAKFTFSMQSARCGRASYEDLRDCLLQYNILHSEINLPG